MRAGLTLLVLAAASIAALVGAATATAAVCGAGTVTATSMHSPDGTKRPFYGDFKNGSTKHSGYVGYELSGASGVLGNDVWIKLSGFTGGSVGLATNQSAAIPVRATTQAGNPLVYAYLTAASATTTAQSWTVEVWNGKPGQVGSTQVCTTTDGFSKVLDVISAGANKITSMTVSTTSPAIGGKFDITAVGDTGTMGAGDASDQFGGNGVFSMAPSMDDSWPADAFQLTGVRLTIGGTTVRDKLRTYLATSAAGAYTVVYSFTARKAPAAATSVFPVQNIASGSQVKYTGSYNTSLSLAAPSVTVTLTKTPQGLTGPPYVLNYTVVAANTSSSPVTLDYLRDTPTSSGAWSFTTGSARLDGTAIADPVNDAGTLVFSGPFTVPANGSLTFTYALNVSATVSNSVVGQVGDVTLGNSGGNNQVTVNPAVPAITTASLPDATAGVAYDQTLTATGGTGSYTWSVLGGSLPGGLSLNPITGRLSGTPTAAGSSSFTVQATDGASAGGSKAFTIATAAPAPADTTAPSGSIVLAGGTATTSSQTIAVALSGTDAVGVTRYRLAEGSDCSAAGWVNVTATTNFSATDSLTLSVGEGTKTVCVQYGDAAGNVSTAATATITYDLPPTVVVSSAAAGPTNAAFSVTATFSKAVSGFTLADLTIGNGTASNLAGSGATYSFDVAPSAQGTVTIDLGAGAATDAAGTASTAASQLTRTYDSVRPTLALSSAAPTQVNAPFSVTATFSEAVTGVALADLAVTNGSASNLTGSGTTYTFDVTPTAAGAVSVGAGANVAADTAGNGNTAATSLSRTYDPTAPSVTLSSAAADSVSGAFSVTATFSESVSGFALGDLAVANGTASALTGSGATYSFTVTPAADGLVTVALGAGSAADTAGNASTAATSLTRTADLVAPSLALASTAPDPVNGGFAVTATFSEPVLGFAAGDVTVANGTVSAFAGSGSSYSFTVTPVADGAVTVDVDAGAATDTAGNASLAASGLSRTFDGTRPSVALSSSAADPVSGGFSVTATFSESVTGFALGDLALTNATASSLAGSGTTYTFDVAPTADGTVTVALGAGAAADAAGNPSLAAVPLLRSADATAPAVSLATTAPDPVRGAFTVTASFDEPVTGLAAGDVAVGNGSISGFSGSGTTYSFLVTPAADGAVTVDVAAGAATDAAGNPSLAATELTRAYDGGRPAATLSTSASSPTRGGFAVALTFSESVTGLTLGDLTLTNATASNLTGSGASYSFDVTPASDGTVTVALDADSAVDVAGNGNSSATPLTRLVDMTRPSLTLASAAAAPVRGTFHVTATFSEPVTGFSLADVHVANGTASSLTGSGSGYGFDVTPAADGTVTVAVGAGGAEDAVGNQTTEPRALTRDADVTGPAVTLSSTAPAEVHGAFSVTATFAEAVAGFELADIAVANGAASNLSGSGRTYTFDVSPVRAGAVTVDVAAGAASDAAGNPAAAAATLMRTYVPVAPTIAITEHPQTESADGTATFRFDGENTRTYTCSVDGGASVVCASPFTLGDLEPGGHTLVVHGIAASGAVSSAQYTWTVVAPPALVFTLQPPVESQAGGAFTWVSPAADTTFSCVLDAVAPVDCVSPWYFTDLEDGTHTFTVRSNAGGTTSLTWTVHHGATSPPASVVIVPKIKATDLVGRPQPFGQAQDVARSKGPFTRKLNVELKIPTPENVGSDIVYISNYPDFRDVRVFPIAADERYDWNLLAGPSGDRRVYIRFSDDPGAAVGEATIVLDQELPALRPKFLRIGKVTPAQARAESKATAAAPACGAAPRRWLRIGGADRFSGLNAVQIASNTSRPCAWRPFVPAFSYRLPSRVIYVRVADRVGNISRWYRVKTRR